MTVSATVAGMETVRADLKVKVGLTITADQREWLDRAAADRSCSASAVMRAALDAYRRLHPNLGESDA